MKIKNSTLAPKAKTGNPIFRIVCFFAILATLISLTTISALAANGVWDGSGNTSGGDGGATVVDGDYNLEYADSRDIYGYRFTVFDANGTKLGKSVDVMFKADHNPTYRTQNKRSHTELYDYYLRYGTVALGSFYSRVTFTSSYNGSSMSLYYDSSLPSTPTSVEDWLKANNGAKAEHVADLCDADNFGFESTYIVCEPLIAATLDPMDGGSAAVYCMTIAEYAVYQSVAVGSWTSVPAYSTTGNYTVIMRHLSAFFPKYLYAEMEYSGVFATKPIDPDTHIWTPTSAGLYESHLLVGDSVWANTSADILKYQMGMAIYKDVVEVPYQITLDHQGGTGTLNQFYEKYGEKFFLSAASTGSITSLGSSRMPTRAGYTFGGYYTSPNGGGTQVVDASGNIKVASTYFKADQTIYAKWTENFLKVVYHSNSATEILWQGSATTETYLNNSLYNSYFYATSYTGGLRNGNSTTHLYMTKTGYTLTGYWIVDSPSGTIRIHQDDTSCPTGKALAEKMGYSLDTGSKTVHVYAEWKPITAAVTFHRNTSGTDTVTSSQTFTYGLSGQKFADPGWTRSGYELLGWALTPDATDATYSLQSTVSNAWILENTPSVDLYAVWKQTVFVITLDHTGGTSELDTIYEVYDVKFYSDTETKENIYMGYIPLPEREGWFFEGYVDADGNWIIDDSGLLDTSPDYFTEDTTIFAEWTSLTGVTYKVRHYLQDVDLEGYTLVEEDVFSGTAGTSVTPGVNTYTGFTSPATITKTISKDGNTVFNYLYRRIEYEVTVVSGTGISSTTGGGFYYYGQSVRVEAEVLEGYSWKNWTNDYTYHNATGKIFTFTMPAQDITLTANATPITYTVVYDGNGATGGSTDDSVHTYNVAKALSTNGYTRTGYTFVGWTTNEDGTGTRYRSGQSVKNLTTENGAVITLYAYWSPASTTYTVRHYLQDVDLAGYTLKITNGYTTTTGTEVTPTVNTYEGFDSPDAETVVVAADGSTVVDYYYNRKIFTVTLNYGTGIASVTGAGMYAYGAEVDILASPSPGYSFGGWSGTYSTSGRTYSFTMPASDVTMTASATAGVYRIYLDKQEGTGGTSGMYEKYGVKFYTSTSTQESVTSVTIPTRTDYTFGGYFTSTNGSGAQVIDANGNIIVDNTFFTANTTIYAYWTAEPTYTVTLVKGTGITSVTGGGTYKAGDTVTISAVVSTGYTWSSWTGSMTLANATASFTMPANDVTLTANAVINVYTITLDKQSGTGGTSTMYEQYGVKFYTNVNTLYPVTQISSLPTRSGYTFGGYFTKTDGEGVQVINANGNIEVSYTYFTADTTVYAYWEAVSYKITYDENGGSSVSDKTYTITTSLTLAAAPTRTGYTFAGWKLSSSVGNWSATTYTASQAIGTGKYGNITLVAQWTQNAYTVTWQNYDYTELEVDTDVPYGTTPSYNGATPTRADTNQYTYTFKGWTPTVSAVTGNVTYRATYTQTEREYTITYNENGGSTVSDLDYTYSDAVTLAAAPSRTGYTFTGWKLTYATGNWSAKTYSASEYIGTGKYGNITLVAQWKINTYTVTWQNYDYTELEVDTGVNYGTMPTYNGSTPTRPATAQYTYTFSGWSPVVSTVTGDVTYQATFTQTTRTYTVTWVNDDGTVLETDRNVAYGTTPSYNSDTPAKDATAQYSYAFSGWTPAITKVTGDITYTATFERATEGYTVTWKNHDGTILEVDTNVLYGTMPSYDSNTPTKDATAQYTYTFSGWTPVVSAVTGNVTYKATFTSVLRTYTVTWKNYNSVTLETDRDVAYGTMPSYDGATPTRDSTAQYAYTFSGWTPEVSVVTGDITYTAQFTASERTYTVTWKNYNSATLETDRNVGYGTMPSYDGTTPTKPATAQYTYSFSGWAPEISEVTGDVTYTAQFTESLRYYTVTWNNYNGTTLETDKNVAYGTVPTYNGSTPTKPSTAQYSYTFSGWSPEVSAVTGSITYTAQFAENLRYYTITWKHEDGSILETDRNVAYGATPSFNGDTPSKDSTAQYNYTFAGWDPAISKVTGDATYTATFVSSTEGYTVTWKNQDGTILEVDTNVLYGTMPSYNGDTPTKDPTAQYSYTFSGWSPSVSTVTGNVIYTATYTQTVRTYTVTWKNYNGVELEKDTNVSYGATPSYNSTTPTRASTAQYSYTFSGWTPTISKVTGDVTYTAVFAQTVRKYTVTWENYNHDDLETDVVEYGKLPTYDGVPPSKPSDAQYDYVFDGWTPTVSVVTGDVTYTAVYTESLRSYTVTWKNDDGTTLETDRNVPYGTTPTFNGTTPTKAATAQYRYTFTGWTPQISPVTGDITYTATYVAVTEGYTVTWKNDDGTILEVDSGVAYGTMPSYNGATPTKATTAQYSYSFAGWTPAVSTVTGDVIYTATFAKEVRGYTVTWKNYDGSKLEVDTDVPYGSIPSYNGSTPTKPATAQYSYTFVGWTPAISQVTGDVTYTAVFTSETEGYTVTWKDHDGTTLEVDTEVAYGTTPSYDGTTPTRGSTAQYIYTFAGWTPTVSPVTGDVVYTAKYTATVRSYTVTWVNYDGTVLETDVNVPYGATPSYNSATPTKPSTAQYAYTFAGWTPAISVVTGDVTYTATFTEATEGYTVTWVNSDGTTLETDTNVPYGTLPTYNSATPTKAATAQYTYTFSGWSPTIAEVTGDVTYTATYTATVRRYTVTWVNYDGTVLETDVNVRYGATPSYNSATPTKPSTAQYIYTFAGWTPAVSQVTGNVTYTAKYTETLRSYTVTWENYNGDELEQDVVEYGKLPTYDGTTPTKPSDEQYDYNFDGWTPVISEVTGDITYTAQYEQVERSYTITYNSNGGSVVAAQTYKYSTSVKLSAAPTRTGYTFAGWKLATATGNWTAGTYTAEQAIGTGKYGNIVLEAVWLSVDVELVKITLIYIVDGVAYEVTDLNNVPMVQTLYVYHTYRNNSITTQVVNGYDNGSGMITYNGSTAITIEAGKTVTVPAGTITPTPGEHTLKGYVYLKDAGFGVTTDEINKDNNSKSLTYRVKFDVELEEIYFADAAGNRLDMNNLIPGITVYVHHIYRNNSAGVISVDLYRNGVKYSSITNMGANSRQDLIAFEFTPTESGSFSISGAIYRQGQTSATEQYESNLANNAKSVSYTVAVADDLEIEIYGSGDTYLVGSEAITSFTVTNNNYISFTPGNPLRVTVTIKAADGTTITTQTQDVIVPAREQQLGWIRWTVPNKVGVCTIEATVEVLGSNRVNVVADTDVDTGTIYSDADKFPPDTQYEESKPSGWTRPTKPSTTSDSASWSVWEFNASTNTFVEVTYGISVTPGTATITPNSPTAYFENGKWYMKSGYGFTISATNATISSLAGCVMPDADDFTTSQWGYVTFPEFKYLEQKSGENYVASIEFIDGVWVFSVQDENGRQHFTPIWYPDSTGASSAYYVKLVQTEIWTPVGKLTVTCASTPIYIEGDIYDDWYTN